jgi:AhpC/TSA family
MRNLLRLIILVFSVAASLAGTGIVLSTLDGRRVNPLGDSSAKAVVFVFTRSDCPISNRYAPELERLYEKYGPSGIDFWLVYVDPSESDDSIRRHVHEYGYRFGALLDRKHQLVAMAKPVVTPEVAVYAGGQMVYRGRIDNRYVSFGQARRAATEHDVEQVLESLAAGRPVAPRTTHAIGCFIEDLKSP